MSPYSKAKAMVSHHNVLRVQVRTAARVTHLFTGYHPITVQATIANKIQAFPGGEYLIIIPIEHRFPIDLRRINTPSSQKIHLQTRGAYPYESGIWSPKAFVRFLEGLTGLRRLR